MKTLANAAAVTVLDISPDSALALIMEATCTGLWTWDVVTDLVRWSPQTYTIHGLRQGEFAGTGQAFFDLVHPEDRQRVRMTVLQAIQARQVYSCAFRIVRPDGLVRWVTNRGRATYGAEGEPETVLGTITDQTDQQLELQRVQQEAEEALRLTNQLFQTALAASSAVVFAQDRHLRYTWIHNPALGYSPEEVCGRTDSELFSRARDARVIEAFKRQVLITGRPDRREIAVWHDGTSRVYDLMAQPQRSKNGEITGVVCAAVEVTDRKAQERRLRRREAELKAFVDEAPAAIAMLDHELRFVAATRRFLADHRLDGQALEGLCPDELQPPLDPRLLQDHARCLAGEVVAHPAEPFTRADGSRDWMEWTLQPWQADDGSVGGLLLFSEVVTQRVESRQRLERNAETFYRLIQNNPFGVYVVDADFRLAHVSRGSRRTFAGVDPLIGRPFEEVLRAIWPEPAASGFIEHFRHTLASGEPYEATRTVEKRLDIEATEAYDWRIERISMPDGRFGVVCYYYDLTERQRQESELREAVLMSRVAMDAAAMRLWQADLDTGRFRASMGAAQLLGLKGPGPWTIAEASACCLHDDAWSFADQLQALRTPPHALACELQVPGSQGEMRSLFASGRPLADERGATTGRIIGAFRDVTEERLAKAELERAHALLDAVLEAIPAAVVISDHTGRLVRWNDANERFWGNRGTEPASFDGVEAYQRCRGWRHPSGTPVGAHDWPMARSIERHEFVNGELIEIEPFDDSGRKVAMFMSAPVLVGNVLVGSVAVQTDITAHVRSEQALESANARLLEATRAASIGIHEFHPQQGTLIWDDKLREWWGLEPGEPVTFERFEAGVHPQDRAAMQAAVHRAFDPSGDGRYEAEYRVVHPSGRQRWIYATGQVSFADGQAVRLIGTAQDVTEHRSLTERLRTADRQKDVFLATLSHELRNPLAPALTAAELLGDPRLDGDRVRKLSAVVQRQIRRFAALLDDLLDISRITQGQMQLKREVVSLMSVVDAAVETVQPLMERKRHRLLVSLPPEPVAIDVDPLRLSQVLANLLTNAGKYTDTGGVVELKATVRRQELTLEVVDNGIGLPPGSEATLFDMFVRVEGNDDRGEGGLGLGLALAKGLVELHGGSIGAHSLGRGLGSTFVVRLPEAVASADAAELLPRPHKPALRRLTVLIVDDNRDAADTLGLVLEGAGHEVRVCYDGRSALVVASVFRPEFVLLDVGMPDMNGYEVARALRLQPAGRSMTLVALTGWGREADVQQAQAAGFDRHLTKPVDSLVLQSLLAGEGSHPAADPP